MKITVSVVLLILVSTASADPLPRKPSLPSCRDAMPGSWGDTDYWLGVYRDPPKVWTTPPGTTGVGFLMDSVACPWADARDVTRYWLVVGRSYMAPSRRFVDRDECGQPAEPLGDRGVAAIHRGAAYECPKGFWLVPTGSVHGIYDDGGIWSLGYTCVSDETVRRLRAPLDACRAATSARR